MASPFSIFRKHQKVMMVVLTGMAMFAFIILDTFAQTAAGGLPFGIVLLLAAIAGGCVFWLLGSSGGRGKEWALTGAVLGIAVAIVLPRFFAEAGAVSTSAGNLSDEELFNLMQRRRIANEIVGEVFALGNPPPTDFSAELANLDPRFRQQLQQHLNRARQEWEGQLNSVLFGPATEQGVLLTWLMSHEADRMGVAIPDRVVVQYLFDVSQGKLTQRIFARMRKKHKLSESELTDILRYELRASRAMEVQTPDVLPTPEDYWDLFRRFYVRQELELTAIPVDKFEPEVKDASKFEELPADVQRELRAFFEQHKDEFPGEKDGKREPGSPGFRQPRKVQLAYLEADFDKLKEEMFPDEITEEQLRGYYEEHREQFRNPAFQPEEEETPAPTAPSANSPPRKQGTPEVDETPAPTAPASEGDAKPAQSTPAESKPASDGPVGEQTEKDATKPESGASAADNGQAGVSGAFGPLSFVSTQDPPAAAASDAADTAAADDDEPVEAPRPAGATTGGSTAARIPRRVPLPPPLPEDPEPEFLSLEAAKERVRRQLEQERDEKVREELDRRMQLADRKLYELSEAFRGAGRGKKLTEEQVSQELKKYAGAHDLRYVPTKIQSFAELAETSVGRMIDPGASPFDADTIAQRMFAQGKNLYVRFHARDPLSRNRIVGWKTYDEDPHVPEFTEEGVWKQVLEAWKKSQGAPKAKQRAEELAKIVREQTDKPMQEALSGKTVTGATDGQELTVHTTSPFSWLRMTSAPDPSPLSPPQFRGISQVDHVPDVGGNTGGEFMETVFNELEPGDVGVVPNSDRTVYYVVRVKDRSSADEGVQTVLREELMREPLFEGAWPYQQMLAARRNYLQGQWIDRLHAKYDVRWNRQPDAALQDEQAGRKG
ncbi:MAG: hypothetical protein KY476_14905 [Planctomycetes bacterium]|nr:hypothetical protein [Planctomycetota bacterium]